MSVWETASIVGIVCSACSAQIHNTVAQAARRDRRQHHFGCRGLQRAAEVSTWNTARSQAQTESQGEQPEAQCPLPAARVIRTIAIPLDMRQIPSSVHTEVSRIIFVSSGSPVTYEPAASITLIRRLQILDIICRSAEVRLRQGITSGPESRISRG